MRPAAAPCRLGRGISTELEAIDFGLQVAGREVYREEFGPVAWVKTDGSDCRLLADYYGKGTENMKTALDADYVYFIEKDTRVLVVPK